MHVGMYWLVLTLILIDLPDFELRTKRSGKTCGGFCNIKDRCALSQLELLRVWLVRWLTDWAMDHLDEERRLLP